MTERCRKSKPHDIEKAVSNITNCYIWTHKEGGAIFEFDSDGRAKVNMQGYLIAPLSLFSKRQLKALARKHEAQFNG